jgi:hypothetical protein
VISSIGSGGTRAIAIASGAASGFIETTTRNVAATAPTSTTKPANHAKRFRQMLLVFRASKYAGTIAASTYRLSAVNRVMME